MASILRRCRVRPNSIFFLPTKHVRDVNTNTFVTRVRRASSVACHVCSFGHGSTGNGAHRLRASLTHRTVGCRILSSCHAGCSTIGSRPIRLITYPCFAASLCSVARGVDYSCSRLSSFIVFVYVRNSYQLTSGRNGRLTFYTNRAILLPTAARGVAVAPRRKKGIGVLRACIWDGGIFVLAEKKLSHMNTWLPLFVILVLLWNMGHMSSKGFPSSGSSSGFTVVKDFVEEVS